MKSNVTKGNISTYIIIGVIILIVAIILWVVIAKLSEHISVKHHVNKSNDILLIGGEVEQYVTPCTNIKEILGQDDYTKLKNLTFNQIANIMKQSKEGGGVCIQCDSTIADDCRNIEQYAITSGGSYECTQDQKQFCTNFYLKNDFKSCSKKKGIFVCNNCGDGLPDDNEECKNPRNINSDSEPPTCSKLQILDIFEIENDKLIIDNNSLSTIKNNIENSLICYSED